MNEREKCQLCVNVCQAVCGFEGEFSVSTLNPPHILHEGHTWSINQFLNMNWIAWAMRFAQRDTVNAMMVISNDENLDFESMTEIQIQFEWFCAMSERMC